MRSNLIRECPQVAQPDDLGAFRNPVLKVIKPSGQATRQHSKIDLRVSSGRPT